DVRLVGQSQNQYATALHCFVSSVQRVGRAVHNVFRHGGVDFARKLDEAGVLAILTRLPGKVEWINWNAVPAQTWPRVKRHKTERLCFRGFDYFPDVDPHRGVYQLELVNKRNINAPKNVFQKLGRFRDTARRNGHDGVDRFTIMRHRTIETGWSVTPYNLGNQLHLALFVRWIFSLRREGKVKIHPGLHARTILQHGAQILIGCSWIRCRFQYDQCPFGQMRRNCPAGIENERDIRLTVFAERRWYTNDYSLHFLNAAEVRGRAKPLLLYDVLNRRPRNMLDVALALVNQVHLDRINIQSEHRNIRARKLDRQRQTDIPQTDNTDFHGFELTASLTNSFSSREDSDG